MEKIFENYYKNIEYLKRENEKWDEFFKDLNFPPENIEFLETNTGEFSAKVKLNGKNIFLSSSVSPEKEGKILLEDINNEKKYNFVILGIGTGNILNEILSRFNDMDILVIEPKKEIFQTFLSLNNFDEKYEKVKFIISENENVISLYFLETLRNTLFSQRELKIYINPNLYYNFEIYKRIFKILKDSLNSFSLNLSTRISFRNYHFRNTILNLKKWGNSPGIKNFKNKFKNFPGLAIASGPSLDKVIDYVKEFKNKSVIICAPTSLKPLIKKGIKPDIVASVDPQPITYHQFENVDLKDIYLLANEHTLPEVVDLFEDRVIFFELSDRLEFIDKKEGIFISGTVATCLLSFLNYCGCNPIILMGFDFSFEGKKHHVSSSFYEDIKTKFKIFEEKYDDLNLIEVEGNYQEKVKTDRVYYNYLKAVSNYIKVNKEKTKFINCTYGGAKIENTELLTPHIVIENYLNKEMNILSEIKNIIKKSKKPDKKKINKKIREIKNKINEIEKLSIEGIELCNKAFFEFKLGKGIEILKEMEKLNKKIFKYEKEIDGLMDTKILLPYLKGEIWKLSEEQNKEEWLKFQRDIYSGIYIGCNQFKELLKGGF